MGSSERNALKRCQILIAPYAESGETVEDFDVGWFGGAKFDLVATDRTLWVLPSSGGDPVKLPYADISTVIWQPMNADVWILTVLTRSGEDVAVEIRGPRGLGAALQRRASQAGAEG